MAPTISYQAVIDAVLADIEAKCSNVGTDTVPAAAKSAVYYSESGTYDLGGAFELGAGINSVPTILNLVAAATVQTQLDAFLLLHGMDSASGKMTSKFFFRLISLLACFYSARVVHATYAAGQSLVIYNSGAVTYNTPVVTDDQNLVTITDINDLITNFKDNYSNVDNIANLGYYTSATSSSSSSSSSNFIAYFNLNG